ncbi:MULTISPECIES: AlwI family type II restriction endonuclease [unclassified Mammaliicoccus]|uniref:AlwI family type II restriction endonuclease n=1 Tax=unclassified Mammaliicoccus TaxID=2803851 RepID=UPI001EFACB82|nr:MULTISPECIES: AlwI family type II restriction endonuclease [unclassified Mammaliicoccus]
MKLSSSKSLFNMGDTSLRVKRVLDINKLILDVLHEFKVQGNIWEKNLDGQELYYKMFISKVVEIEKIENIKLFDKFSRIEDYKESSKKGFRGRTNTNHIVKIGFINYKRDLTEVGELYRLNENKKCDELEKLLNINQDNIVYLRQLLKLRIYSHKSNKYFYNFRFALKFLSKYNNVPSNDFFKIIESIKPDVAGERIKNILNDYNGVQNGEVLFDEFYYNVFKDDLINEEEEELAKQVAKNNEISKEIMKKLFSNGKSKEASFPLYNKFVIALLDLTKNSSEESFNDIRKLSMHKKIKKAFGFNKTPFKFIKDETVSDFIDNNIDNLLLSGDFFEIYRTFLLSKKYDLIREYQDMCKRVFNVSGMFNFDNNLVNLANPWLITPLLSILEGSKKYSLFGEDNYSEYEKDNNSIFFKDISTIEILGLNKDELIELMTSVSKKYEIEDISNLQEIIQSNNERDFKKMVNNKFTKQKVINLLEEIVKRNDDYVQSQVTEEATIPTILEWLLVIAWYHISNESFSLLKSYNLTLDGNFLPLRHAPGGMGDLEIKYNDKAILMEATLMDTNSQKRGELEPVIRHSTNFAIENNYNIIQTLLIANEIDNNVSNIFRALKHVDLFGTIHKGCIEGINIFPITIAELISLMNNSVSAEQIIEIINNNLEKEPTRIKSGWRTAIIEKMFYLE